MADLDARVADGVVFEPETILPSQWTDPAGAPESGERRLCWAVLMDGLVLAGRGSSGAIRWMRSNSMASPFAFLRVCELFEYDPQVLRRRILGRATSIRRVHRLAESGRPGLNATLGRGPGRGPLTTMRGHAA